MFLSGEALEKDLFTMPQAISIATNGFGLSLTRGYKD